MIDPSLFSSSLAKGAGRINSMLGRPSVNFSPSQVQAPLGSGADTNKTGKMRTDRNNNPTAMTTDAARTMGLVPGMDYVAGDPFPNNPNLRTAKLLGDPIKTTIKAIDKGGFYTSTGKPRWTYLNNIAGIQNWSNATYDQKAQIVAQMYHHEGGDGSLVAKPTPASNPFAFNGGGGPITGGGNPNASPMRNPASGYGNLSRLGNITTNFGDQNKDTNFHTGIDIANRQGTPIPKVSGVGGVVQAVQNNGDYGNQAVIKNDDGTTETYSHLHQAMVQPGQRVNPGQEVATMGHSGNAWSPSGGDPSHLHYEVTDAYNRFVNPIKEVS